MNYEVSGGGVSGCVMMDGMGFQSLYRVFIYNDDFTPMEFVLEVLETFFNMERSRAAAVMLDAHQTGKSVCGEYGRDLAETRVFQVQEYARKHGHPLYCSMEAA